MTTIGMIGRICSGKSTIAKKLSAHFDIPIISFGAYLTKYSKDNNLPTDRDLLQNLGNKFIKEDSNKFLRNAIASQSTIPDSMIVEGIRHLSIRRELSVISKKSIFLFVEASAETRYNRYRNRKKESDNRSSYEEFIAIDNHKVESEIDLLKSQCQIIYNSETSNYDDLLKLVNDFINSNQNTRQE